MKHLEPGPELLPSAAVQREVEEKAAAATPHFIFFCLCYADPHFQEFMKHLESGPELLPSAAVQREQEEKAAAANTAAGISADAGIKVGGS